MITTKCVNRCLHLSVWSVSMDFHNLILEQMTRYCQYVVTQTISRLADKSAVYRISEEAITDPDMIISCSFFSHIKEERLMY